jgi:hypothetical protein
MRKIDVIFFNKVGYRWRHEEEDRNERSDLWREKKTEMNILRGVKYLRICI